MIFEHFASTRRERTMIKLLTMQKTQLLKSFYEMGTYSSVGLMLEIIFFKGSLHLYKGMSKLSAIGAIMYRMIL